MNMINRYLIILLIPNWLCNDVYNPFDILLFISKGHAYKNYWFETGTPKFLIDLIKQENYFLPNLSNLIVSEKLLNSFDIENKEDALQQIKDKAYAQKYLDYQKEIYLVGINFDEDEKNIVKFEWEKM